MTLRQITENTTEMLMTIVVVIIKSDSTSFYIDLKLKEFSKRCNKSKHFLTITFIYRGLEFLCYILTIAFVINSLRRSISNEIIFSVS